MKNTANILRILTFMASRKGPVAAQQISRELSIPRSTTYELLDTLCEYGYSVSLMSSHKYALSTRAFELSSAYSRQEPLSRLGQVLLRNLVDRLGEGAHLAVLQGSDVVYIVEERAPRRPTLVTATGVRLPAHQTASGRAILAAMPPQQVRAIYAATDELPSRDGAKSPSSRAELLRELNIVREQGYAVEQGEVTSGLASAVVPVYDHTSKWPLAALGITFELARHSDVEQTVAALVPELRRFADELSRRLGGLA